MGAEEIASLAAYYCDNADVEEKTLTIPAAMAAYVNVDKLRAGLTFDDYTVTDVVGNYDATAKGTSTFVEGYNGVGYETSVGNYISYEDLKFGNDSFAETTFLFCRLVGQDVAVIGVMTHDFARTCDFKTLRSAAFCFHFRHGNSPYV